MIPESLIQKLNLVYDDQMSGRDSFAKGLRAFKWSAFADKQLYVSEFDRFDNPMKEGMAYLFCIGKGKWFSMHVTIEILQNNSEIILKQVEEGINKIISANELRIGNWLMNNNWHYFQVESIHEGGALNYSWGDWFYEANEYKGIPLSPEILEKCGFVKDANVDGYKLSNCLDSETVQTFTFHDYAFINGEIDGAFTIRTIYKSSNTGEDNEENCHYVLQHYLIYLHQLQNLYFALTGKELEIKL